jgi:hypothetical protein
MTALDACPTYYTRSLPRLLTSLLEKKAVDQAGYVEYATSVRWTIIL